jgi:hypothetical protein
MIPFSALQEFCHKVCLDNPEQVATAQAAFYWFNKALAGTAPKDRPALTARQQELYDFILRFMADNGMAPTRVEMAQHMCVASPNAVEDMLKAIEQKRYIERVPGKARALKIMSGEH